jgi:predicted flap endonuclease-1-like 5' DNA nuclease
MILPPESFGFGSEERSPLVHTSNARITMSTKKFTIAASSQVVKADTLANFMASQLEEDLETVPGVGPKAKEKLEEGGIPTTHALIGLFLTLREKGMSVVVRV